jgi:hypothetical protein
MASDVGDDGFLRRLIRRGCRRDGGGGDDPPVWSVTVGGTAFVVRASVLRAAGPNSVLGALYRRYDRSGATACDAGEFLADRSPALFGRVLAVLAAGDAAATWTRAERRACQTEAEFYGLPRALLRGLAAPRYAVRPLPFIAAWTDGAVRPTGTDGFGAVDGYAEYTYPLSLRRVMAYFGVLRRGGAYRLTFDVACARYRIGLHGDDGLYFCLAVECVRRRIRWEASDPSAPRHGPDGDGGSSSIRCHVVTLPQSVGLYEAELTVDLTADGGGVLDVRFAGERVVEVADPGFLAAVRDQDLCPVLTLDEDNPFPDGAEETFRVKLEEDE